MKTSIAQSFDGLKRKMLPGNSESLGKKVPDVDSERRYIGRLIDRALTLAKKTQQDLAADLGHSGQQHVSAYINGGEAAPLARMLRIEWFRLAFTEALAESTPGVISRRVLEFAS